MNAAQRMWLRACAEAGYIPVSEYVRAEGGMQAINVDELKSLLKLLEGTKLVVLHIGDKKAGLDAHWQACLVEGLKLLIERQTAIKGTIMDIDSDVAD